MPPLIAFLSGFAALSYQVIWQRLLVFFSGADVYSVTIIVAAFMAGLGIGSLAGGNAADRFTVRQRLLAFAAAEIVVGVFAVVSKPLYYDVLYAGYAHLGPPLAVTALVLFLTLLVPTFMMGFSFPLLARAIAGSLQGTPGVIATLYGWNTLGAAAGALAATWMLLPRFGMAASLWILAAANLLCAAAAILLAIHATGAAGDDSGAEAPAAGSRLLTFRAWTAIYVLTGFIALGLEIAWFRLLGVLMKSTALTFGTLLGIYLAGFGAGAAAGARFVNRSRQAGVTFLGIQFGVTIYAALSITALVTSIAAGHPIKLVRYLGSYEPVDIYTVVAGGDGTALSDLLVLYFVLPAILIGPPTFLMGLSFPYLQKATQLEFPRVGRRLGTLLAANIAGGLAGATVVGWVLLPALGTAGTLKFLVGAGAVVGLTYARLQWRAGAARRWAAAGAVGISLTALVIMPAGGGLWSRLHGTQESRVLFDEDASGLSLVKMDPDAARQIEVYVNGLGQSWIPYGGIHTVLGALPAFVHPAPATIAIVGLGSGDTAFAAAGRPDVRRVVSIEILGAQRRTLERVAERHGYPGVVTVVTDPRIEHRSGDGRAYLVRGDARYDVIEADALRPTSAHSGNLYSREYFELLLQRLAPGGLAVTWAPTDRIKATFLDVFPHVAAFSDDVYVGSAAPIVVDAATIQARAAAARAYYAAAGIDIVGLLRPYLEPPPAMYGPDDPRPDIPLNTDLFPRDEFALPFWQPQ